MGRVVQLRNDYDGDGLRRLARNSRDSDQTRRLLALAVVYDGGRRTDAAKIGGVTLQIIRDWVLRFNADGPEGLKNRWSSGPESKLTAEHRQALAEMVERGPIPAIHGVVRWRRCDLAQELYEEFGISVGRGASRPLALGCGRPSSVDRRRGGNLRFDGPWVIVGQNSNHPSLLA